MVANTSLISVEFFLLLLLVEKCVLFLITSLS
jgi:hypothetical protein